MTSLSQASNPAAFAKSAVQFNVSESDFFVLEHLGITTYEGFALRVPSSENLEDFLRTAVLPSSGYKGGDGNLVVFPRMPLVPWNEYRISEDAASLRKLWQVGKEISKAEVERLATGDESSKGRVQIQSAMAMEEASVRRGMPQPGSDVERPSLFCLTKVSKALLGPGASFEYIQWENYITMEEEQVLTRAGKMPRPNKEFVLRGDELKYKDKKDDEAHPVGDRAEDLEGVRKYLDIRARALDMVEAASYGVYKRLNEKYVSKVVGRVPQGMRPPTLEEVRRFDRTLHEELLRWVSRSAGTLDEGVTYHLEHEEIALWRLLDPVVKTLPDQGIESEPKKRKRDDPPATKAEKPAPKKEDSSGSGQKKCLVCGNRHTPFCKLPEGFRKEQREKEKQRKLQQKAKAKAKAASDH